MAQLTMVIAGERWLDEVVLSGSFADIDGNRTDEYFAPATIGDLAIMEIDFNVGSILTMMTNPELRGPRATVVSKPSLTAVDIIGTSNWVIGSVADLFAYLSPDPLVLWRQDEAVRVRYQEVDTNVAPTADITVTIKCVRVRPQEGARAPLRLTR